MVLWLKPWYFVYVERLVRYSTKEFYHDANNKSVARQNRKLVISTPKTPNPIRTVLLPKDTVKLLVEEHDLHPSNPYLFPSPCTGETWDPGGFRRLHDRIISERGGYDQKHHPQRDLRPKPKRRLQLAAAVKIFGKRLENGIFVLFCQINLDKSTAFSRPFGSNPDNVQ